MKKIKDIGSTLESFLQEEDISEEVRLKALKTSIANLLRAYKRAYDPCRLIITRLEKELESQQYSACTFIMNNKIIKFRSAKITPHKVGQFVTFWKRIEKGPIIPFDSSDSFDFFVVSVAKKQNLGQFIFPKKILSEKGILSKNQTGGTRAIRVYPPWDLVESKPAKKTQAWQLDYFVEIEPNPDLEKIKTLFR